MTLEELLELCASKHKENIIYSRIVFEEINLRKTTRIMDLSNPMMDELEKQFVSNSIEQKAPVLNVETFLRLYQEDGLRHLVKNIEFWINNQFRTLNSYNK